MTLSLGGLVSLFFLVGFAWPHAVSAWQHYRAEPLPVPGRFVQIAVREPSGAAYHPTRGTILVVSDEGQLVEMDRDFKVLQTYEIPGDLEGISVHPATGTVFIAIENDCAIVEYDLEMRRILRTLVVDLTSHDDFDTSKRGNKGLEGVAVAVDADGAYRLFAVVEASPARLVSLSADVSVNATEQARGESVGAPFVGMKQNVEVVASYDVGLARISDVVFDIEMHRLLITATCARLLSITDLAGRTSLSIRLPGMKPEGFCFLPNGDAVVAEDSGGVFLCKGVRRAIFPETVAAKMP